MPIRDFNQAWLSLLERLLTHGDQVAPRGQPTKELPQQTLLVDLERPVLTVAGRKLSYPFMAAEAYWLLSGDDTVAGIAPWNKHIAAFSDDGVTFFGAYGPRIAAQLPYVVATLVKDPTSRQAGLTTWRPSPPATKDVPCTVAMFFAIRQGRLNVHVFMRSSDAWLGIPYDVFNFCMVGHRVRGELATRGLGSQPGVLYLTAASSHLYEPNWEAARACVAAGPGERRQVGTPARWTPEELQRTLRDLRDSKPGDPVRWWET